MCVLLRRRTPLTQWPPELDMLTSSAHQKRERERERERERNKRKDWTMAECADAIQRVREKVKFRWPSVFQWPKGIPCLDSVAVRCLYFSLFLNGPPVLQCLFRGVSSNVSWSRDTLVESNEKAPSVGGCARRQSIDNLLSSSVDNLYGRTGVFSVCVCVCVCVCVLD